MSMPRKADSIGRSHAAGRVRAMRPGPFPGTWLPSSRWSGNLVVRQWASIVTRLLAGESQYKLAGMYLEFENTAAPGDPVSIPSQDRSRGIDYYAGLSGNRDYLRVPLIATTRDSSDLELFPDGNVLTLFSRSAGVVGVHGLDFGVDFNSSVFGAALVAYGHATDYTRDLVFSSYYFPEDEQQPVLSPNHVGMEWELTLL